MTTATFPDKFNNELGAEVRVTAGQPGGEGPMRIAILHHVKDPLHGDKPVIAMLHLTADEALRVAEALKLAAVRIP